MPKRATHTYESEKDGVQDPSLNVHYCMCCGESVLILGPGIELNSLPRRKTDCAYVLEKGTTVFKLKSKPGQTKLLRRPKGFERQYRLNCWNCNVPIAYKCEDSDSAKLTYVLFDATGLQADLYLQLYQVPPCIQPTGERSVRVALEVSVGQAKKAITHVSNAEIGISVCAPSQEGLANSEVIDHMTKVRDYGNASPLYACCCTLYTRRQVVSAELDGAIPRRCLAYHGNSSSFLAAGHRSLSFCSCRT